MRYLYLMKLDDVWTVLTKDGMILTTKEPRPDAPRIQYHPKSTVDFIDFEWMIKEVRDSLDSITE